MSHATHPYALSAQHVAASSSSSGGPTRAAPPGPAQPRPRAPGPSTAGLGQRALGYGTLDPHPDQRRLPSYSTSPSPIATSSSSLAFDPAAGDYSHTAHRTRAESSPTDHRHHADHSAPPPPLAHHLDHGPTRPEPVRRQGSNTVTRRVIVDEHGVERDETRDERRARKERERAHRAATAGQDGSSTRRRRLSRASDGADSVAPSPSLSFGSPASVAAPHIASSSTSTGANNSAASSKSVLTIALQRAQSAVLLDSANNFPAAVAAYTQSVRLLKEVMARVEEGSRDMERKLSTGGMRDGETRDEWERRRARYERKERAKVDEARRLRVIHDTYEDRIRMLAQMGHTAPGHVPPPSLELAPPPSLSSTSLSTAAHDLSAPAPAAAHPPTSSSSAPSLANLRLDDPGGVGRHHNLHARDRSDVSLRIVAPSTPVERDPHAAASGIGAAMLLPSPTERAVPTLSSLPVALAHDGGDRVRYLAPEGDPDRPLSMASDSTATATARSRTPSAATPTLPAPIPFAHRIDPVSPTDSRASSDGLSTAVEPASSWSARPHAFEPASAPVRHPALTSLEMRRGSSASALSGDTLRVGVPGSASAPGMVRAASSGSTTGSATPMRRGSSLGLLGSAEAAPIEIRPRPIRTVSLAGTATAPDEQQPRLQLVNESTAEGTISQRRSARSPVPSDEASMRPPEVAVRAPSSEADRSFAFPPPTPVDSALPRPVLKSVSSASSLPGRLRALSQPGSKRPKGDVARRLGVARAVGLPSSSSTAPAGSLARKASAPTPTSLTAPAQLGAPGGGPLGRSNSSSSVASTASRLSGRASGAPGSPSDTPATSSFPSSISSGYSHPSSHLGGLGGGIGAGIYLSKGLPSPPQPGAPSSREATLALPSVRRPFHLMRLVAATIPTTESGAGGGTSGGGGYLSERLFVPAHVWTTSAGTKLVAIETKVRMLDLLASGLDALDRAGRGMLLVPVGSSSAAAAAREEAARFAKELESFEGLAEGIQSTLAKKLGVGVIGVTGGGIAGGAPPVREKDSKQGRKGSTASFSTWSSKLSMSLNRVVANGVRRVLATYVDAIAKVFRQAQSLDRHLALVFPAATDRPADSAYALLPAADLYRLERHLRKSSEFFAHVICRFVLRDTGILLDKYVKRGGAWLSGE
ncbi:uncharacterized protein RHOBADRAFT_55598 [Rhodotorula graminis WP1]|uniref:MIT domain-containing protein n=1 Tax=Rhodotorula graminis (strain WP1) TaxID=578459 RepID=A0A0P9EME5_RHOGW|nr:uncharacterized protein RHOBADRAFT_55598 [Rhodotorula graminis WP1]KPV72939.1 hypothetical protein RHOBADRAFT_55598 [Rhodotorula graminis WP1]